MKTEPEFTHCPNTKNIVIVGKNKETNEAVLFNPSCKSWTCPVCSQENKAHWSFQALRGATKLQEAGNAIQFVTLTSPPHSTVNSSLYFFKENWPKLVRRASYHTNKVSGSNWAFLLIPERHKTGKLHAHMICSSRLTAHWWHDNAHQTGFGFMVDVDFIQQAVAAAAYVTKYLAKSLEFTRWPKGFRRVRTSRNWPTLDALPLPGWEYGAHDEQSAWWEYYYLQDLGYRVTDHRQH